MIRKAVYEDLDPVACIYEEVHQAEADGSVTTGWIRDIYPVKATAKAALERNDLFVLEEEADADSEHKCKINNEYDYFR